MDTKQPTKQPESFKDIYGYEPLEPKAMAYWKAATPYHPFFNWTKVCSVAIVKGRSLTEDELKELIQVDEIGPDGDHCQFDGCTRRVMPQVRGSYLCIVLKSSVTGNLSARVGLYCYQHAQIARRLGQDGKKPLPLMSFATATAKAVALNARFEQERAGREAYVARRSGGGGGYNGPRKGNEFPGEGQSRDWRGRGRDRGRGRRDDATISAGNPAIRHLPH